MLHAARSRCPRPLLQAPSDAGSLSSLTRRAAGIQRPHTSATPRIADRAVIDAAICAPAGRGTHLAQLQHHHAAPGDEQDRRRVGGASLRTPTVAITVRCTVRSLRSTHSARRRSGSRTLTQLPERGQHLDRHAARRMKSLRVFRDGPLWPSPGGRHADRKELRWLWICKGMAGTATVQAISALMAAASAARRCRRSTERTGGA